jgi:uncharacterized protein YbjT (DUF2867 family)
MADKKIITVLGATGAQGGGLVRAICGDPAGGFVARAVTRDTKSDKARALADLGAQVVQGDVDDPASLKNAFQGAYGAFCITFFWAHFSVDKELAEAKLMADTAKAAGLKHVVWSTLEDTRKKVPLSDNRMPTLQGKYKVPHFDGKGEADHFFRDAGVPTTFLLTSFYYDNLIHFGMGPKKDEQGNLVFHLPMGQKKLPAIAAEDIGRCAYGVFKKGNELINKYVGIAGAHLTGDQWAASLSKALGQPVKYNAVPFDVYRKFGFPGADDLGNMFQYKHDFNEEFTAARSIEKSRALNPQLQSFDQWLAKNKTKIPIG